MSQRAPAWAVEPSPATERLRLAAVAALRVQRGPEERFDRITRLAARLLDARVAMLNVVDEARQWSKSATTAVGDVPRPDSFCAVVVDGGTPLVVGDLGADPRFAAFPAVAEGWRAYAGVPLHDVTGQPVGTLCLLDDRPRAFTPEQLDLLGSLAGWAESELGAAQLRERVAQISDAEQSLRDVLDGAPAAVLLVDDRGAVLWHNDPAGALFGPHVADRELRDLLPALDLEALAAQGRRAGEQRHTGRRLVQVGRAPGRAFPAEVAGSPLPGTPRRWVVFVRDLGTEQAEQEELEALQERTAVVLDALAEGVFVLDAGGRTAFGNLAGARLLRRRRTDLAGADWHGAVHAGGCPTEPCPLADPLALAGRRLSPVFLDRRDAEPLPVEVSVSMVRDGSGAPGVVVTLDDLTERLKVDRLKDEFISSVSHELRTPLTSLRGSLGLLAAGVVPVDGAQGRRLLDVAVGSTDRLRRLVDDILDLERLHSGRAELLLGRHLVGPLLKLAAQAVSGVAVERGVLLDVRDSDLAVTADADRVVQVLVNLLGNAVKFSPAGSTVQLSARAAGDRVRLSVADQGRGIAPEQLDRVFDRFAQLDAGDAREHGGSGLGLAIARGLAEQHGGSLSATSEVGVGSTFVLELPAAGERA